MKLVHNRLKAAKEKPERIAHNLSVPVETANEYEKIIRNDRYNEKAYERLMIIYRKNKEYAKELKLIDAAISAFRELYSKTVRRKPDNKTIRLSKALLKLTGLSDKKGNPFYHREPINKWIKRKSVLLSKMQTPK